MPSDDQVFATELAKLTIELKSLHLSVDEIKSSLQTLVTLDKMLSELTIHSNQTRENVSKLWQRYDAVKQWQQDHSNYATLIREEMDNAMTKVEQALSRDVNNIDKKVDAWTNRVSGATMVLGFVASFIQLTVLGLITWALLTIVELRDNVNVLQVKYQQTEQQQRGSPK